ncbi:hypothetical protein OIU82_12480 [Escherichia coli]|nr:hypothetical protein [Escherichia coli]
MSYAKNATCLRGVLLYICNLNAALAMLGKFLEFAGVLCNLHIKWLIFAQDWWVRNGLSLLNKGLRGYTSANNFL